MTKTVYCDDWRCPAKVSCAKHFGRSAAYGRMEERARVDSIEQTGRFNWMQGPDAGNSCAEYRLDKPKAWLMPRPGEITHFPEL
jgi:hypothetical protein